VCNRVEYCYRGLRGNIGERPPQKLRSRPSKEFLGKYSEHLPCDI